MIRLETLGYAYRQTNSVKPATDPESSLWVLHTLNLTIPDQSMVALLGPNGSGKSTLLKIIAGELTPSQGQVGLSPELQGAIGYLSQSAQFDVSIPVSVFEVAAMGLLNRRGLFSAITAADKARVTEMLARVGLLHLANHNLQELSGGQLQRLRFARLLVEDAKLLLLDEPFNAVDENTQRDLLMLLNEQHRAGCTIITALHNQSLANLHFPLHIYLGREIVALSTPATAIVTAPEQGAGSSFNPAELISYELAR